MFTVTTPEMKAGTVHHELVDRVASAGAALSGVQYHISSNRNIGAKLGSIVTRATGSTERGSSELIR